jgi:hypothetical protein
MEHVTEPASVDGVESLQATDAPAFALAAHLKQGASGSHESGRRLTLTWGAFPRS